eukprot:403364774
MKKFRQQHHVLLNEKKFAYVYIQLLNIIKTYKKKSMCCRIIELQVQARPQMMRINKYLCLLWYKNLAQFVVLNVYNKEFVKNFFLSRKENWLQVELVGKIQEDKYQIFMRNNKSLNFYILDMTTESYQLVLERSRPLDYDNISQTYIHYSLLNKSNVCNILNDNYGISNFEVHLIQLRPVETLNKLSITIDDQLIMLNQRYSHINEKPVLLLLSHQQLGVLMDIPQKLFDFRIFQNLNNLIAQINGQNQRQCNIYCLESEHIVQLYIIKKLISGQAYIFRVKIKRAFIKKLQSYIKTQ